MESKWTPSNETAKIFVLIAIIFGSFSWFSSGVIEYTRTDSSSQLAQVVTPKPDLTALIYPIPYLTLNASTSASATLLGRVNNLPPASLAAPASSANFQVRLATSTSGTSTSWTNIGPFIPVSSLPINTGSVILPSASSTSVVWAPTTPGLYEVRFCADSFNIIDELDENNNCSMRTTLVRSDVAMQVCGNNIREGTEVCDGSALNGQSCTTQGYVGGALTCNNTCSGLITSSCFNNTPLSATCAGTKNGPKTIVWTASTTGGTMPLNYWWSGDEGLSAFTASTTKTYDTFGVKNATVDIFTSDKPSQHVTATCSKELKVPSK